MNNLDARPSVKMWCPLTEEQREMVVLLASTGTPAHKIADILGVNTRLFMRDFYVKGTDVFNAYHSGLEMQKAKHNEVTAFNAANGNLTARQIMDKVYEEQRREDLLQKIFNNER